MTTTRAIAVTAYLAAVASPAAADWRSVAESLYAALPAVRGAMKPADAPAGSIPRWFADWKLGKVYSLDSLDVTFADGVTVRCNLAKAPGKLPRIAAACRVAVAFYRERTKLSSVPAFASLVTVSDGSTFDAEACSALTADLRRTAFVPAPVRPAVTAEALAWMEAELKRRRAGLARFDAGYSAGLEGQRAAWAEALAACEREMATMRTALAGPCEPGAPDAEPVTVAAEPESASPAPLCAEQASLSVGSPVEAMGTVDPVEAIEAEPLAALCSDDDWHADESTHPVVALCLSDKARAALFDQIQDGTFPAADRTVRGGAWRLTVADAETCAGLASVRFVGLPRKAYTRRAAPPAVAIRTPVEAIRDVPAAAFIPGATPPGPIVYHAAPQL